jgi:hypothetical protein
MIRSTLGAPFGGTTLGGQYGLDVSASRLIDPPNLGGCGGRYLPSIVDVELGDPGVPVTCWASTGATSASVLASPTARRKSRTTVDGRVFMAGTSSGYCLVCYGSATVINWQPRRLTLGL